MAIRYPSAINAPGANTNISIPYLSGKIVKSKIFPVPRNSLILPKSVRAKVKPIPIPNPSREESKTEFFDAKDSALARTIQLTTISGINKPRLAYKAGTYAFISISSIVTKEAITTM